MVLIEGEGREGEGEEGKEKFCINLNLPGHPAFDTREMGEDWNGPSRERVVLCEKGPM